MWGLAKFNKRDIFKIQYSWVEKRHLQKGQIAPITVMGYDEMVAV